jgi:2-polyprenyl-3-methyl-5-hydroxy-6-metoxy-1,4-benzoquinol methylase
MPANLSFGRPVSTGRFYTKIHSTMVERSSGSDLPPTATEFAAWVAKAFAGDNRGRSVLDCGCGVHAFNIRTCARLGFGRVEAIDINPDVIAALARDGGGIRFTPGSVLDLPSESGQFDLVICSGVAHHTADPFRAFQEIARVMKSDGTAYIALYTFRRSLAEAFVRCIRVAAHVVPYGLAHRAAHRSRVLNNFVLDHMYVPILWVYTAAEARRDLGRAGLAIEADFASSFDVFARLPGGGLLSGDGLLRNFICRKVAAGQSSVEAPTRP